MYQKKRIKKSFSYKIEKGTRWRIWLRHCCTSPEDSSFNYHWCPWLILQNSLWLWGPHSLLTVILVGMKGYLKFSMSCHSIRTHGVSSELLFDVLKKTPLTAVGKVE